MITPSLPRYSRTTALIIALAGAATASASDIVDERTRLATVLRELAAIERLTDTEDVIKDSGLSRRHFSYADLRADIHRVSAGIKHYLSPLRAAPRDVVALDGRYLNEAASD